MGDRSKSVDVPTEYELPPAAIKEAIVNAIAHRDYSSNASVQVMLFRNRLQVWNPGHLPYHLPVSKLKQPHGSFAANPLLAESFYLAGYIERMGTGIPDMVRACAGLKEPDLIQDESFKAILWRKVNTDQVKKLLALMEKEYSRQELMMLIKLKHGQTFRENYLNSAIENKYIEMTMPNTPNSPTQKYRLTAKGKSIKQELKKKK